MPGGLQHKLLHHLHVCFWKVFDLHRQEDYGTFLAAVFEEVRRQQHEETEAYVDVAVEVPEGTAAGQLLLVEYLGVQYEIAVPEGRGPGMVFHTRIATA